MARCANCGGEAAEGARYCPDCGARLEPNDTSGHDSGNSPGEGPSGGSPPEQPPSGGGPRGWEQPRSGRGQRAQGQGPGGGGQRPPPQPQRPPGDGQDGGVSRRTLLAAGGGVVALAGAGAGWYVFLRGPGDPLQVLEQLWSTWENGDADTYQDLFHSDSPERQEEYWNDDQYWAEFGPGDGVDWTIEEREVVDRTETRATVREVYVWRQPDEPALRITDRLEFRTEGSEWKVWEITGQDVEELGGGS